MQSTETGELAQRPRILPGMLQHYAVCRTLFYLLIYCKISSGLWCVCCTTTHETNNFLNWEQLHRDYLLANLTAPLLDHWKNTSLPQVLLSLNPQLLCWSYFTRLDFWALGSPAQRLIFRAGAWNRVRGTSIISRGWRGRTWQVNSIPEH